MSKILFGTDPESFATYKKEDNLYVLPPHYFRTKLGVFATPDIRHPVFLQEHGWKAHEDGAAFEFSIPPSHNPRELFETVQEAAQMVSREILSAFPSECNPELGFIPTVGFDVERWANEGEDFRLATLFGCDPDEDAWDLESECQVIDASKHPYRYAGGHIHISGSPRIAEDPIAAVTSMAFTAGLAAIANSPWPQLERARTFLYGRPSKFRVQNYGDRNPFGEEYAVGIEYRTPSATWAGNWSVAESVLTWAEIGVKNLLEGGLVDELDRELRQEVARTILEADQQTAWDILEYIEEKI